MIDIGSQHTKAHICLDEVAKLVTHPKSNMMIMMAVMADVPAWD